MAAPSDRSGVAEGSVDPEKTARFLPRWAIYLLIPGLIGPVLILVFIFITETAHDEARCAYVKGATQELAGGVTVREDVRSCLPGVEERRYTALRAGSENVLGRRRFRASAFAPGAYSWKANISEQGEVRVDVRNEGHADAVFREGTPAERGE